MARYSWSAWVAVAGLTVYGILIPVQFINTGSLELAGLVRAALRFSTTGILVVMMLARAKRFWLFAVVVTGAQLAVGFLVVPTSFVFEGALPAGGMASGDPRLVLASQIALAVAFVALLIPQTRIALSPAADSEVERPR